MMLLYDLGFGSCHKQLLTGKFSKFAGMHYMPNCCQLLERRYARRAGSDGSLWHCAHAESLT